MSSPTKNQQQLFVDTRWGAVLVESRTTFEHLSSPLEDDDDSGPEVGGDGG